MKKRVQEAKKVDKDKKAKTRKARKNSAEERE